MKKLIVLLLLWLLFMATNSFAATYYVRTDGGTLAQCTGLTDHALAGATGTNCAVNDPMLIEGWNGGNASLLTGGDTIIIGDPGGTPGAFYTGYSAGRSGCTDANGFNCYTRTIPAGASSAARTKIYGRGYDTGCTGTKASMWGGDSVYQIIDIASHTDIQCLDFTDHSNCIFTGPQDGTQGGDPTQCNDKNRGAAPYGAWARKAISSNSASTDILLTNVDIHGMADRGLYGYHNADWTLTNVNIVANGLGGWDNDPGNGADATYTGTTTLIKSSIQWSGCGEKYPITTTDWNSSTDKHHCWSQSQGGYGDGIGLGNGNPGNWTFIDSNISHNTQDGVDLYHGTGGGIINFIRSRAEGNAGQQIKLTGLTNYIENSKIIGNCAFFEGQAFTSTKDNNGVVNAFTSDSNKGSCRGQGNTIVFANSVAAQVMRITGSTIISNGDSAIESEGTNCNGSTAITLKNSIVLAGNDYHGGDITGLYYAAGSNGGGAGVCGSLALTEDYNQVYGTKQGTVSGSHSRYGSPLLTSQSSLLMNTNPNYHGVYAPALTTLGATSPARYSVTGANTADEAATLTSYGSADFYTTSRGSNWDTGAIQYGSTQSAGGYCTVTGDCASGTCTLNACSSTAVCGNNIKESGEACDGTDLASQTCPSLGFVGGTLSCTACAFNTSSCTSNTCGNSTIEAGESCDTANLNSATCITQGYAGGPLACTSCAFDYSSCTAITCGDSIISTGETCDDGNATNGDGCSSLCTTETSGIEKFLTYTESDTPGVLTVAVHKSTMAGMTHAASSNIKYDFGASHFTDFHHRFKVTITACNDNGNGEVGGAGIWAMSASSRADIAAQENASDGLAFTLGCLSSSARYTWKMVDGSTLKDSYDDIAPTLVRYMDVQRTGTTLSFKIYTDALYTNLLKNMTQTVASTAYRYLYTTSSYNDGVSGTAFSGSVENLNVSVGSSPPAATYGRKISGIARKGITLK